MKKIFRYFLLLNLILLTACQVESVDNSLQPFFDINDFLEKELNAISNLKSIKKKVSINGESNEQILDSFDLKKDLEIFKNSNINRVAWLDKYQVDSVFNNANQMTEIKYSTDSKKLKTREVVVHFRADQVESIKIKNSSSNQVSSLEQYLEYFSGKGYHVESIQKVALGKKQTLKIEVDFLE